MALSCSPQLLWKSRQAPLPPNWMSSQELFLLISLVLWLSAVLC